MSDVVGLVAVLYSKRGDLYQVPSMAKPVWLSVQVYALPATDLPVDNIYLGPSFTADEKAWRKAYSGEWRAIEPGRYQTLPADDVLVADYSAITL